MNENYYEILGVSKDATEQEIKKAFRKKVAELHPDRNKDPNAVEKFKKVNEAYQVLSDKEKRRRYDQFGTDGINNGFGAYADAGSQQFQFDFSDLFGESLESFFNGTSIFEEILGGSHRRSNRKNRGNDIHIVLHVDLKDVIHQAEKEIRFKRKTKCKSCDGRGGSKMGKCPVCRGSGRISQVNKSLFGHIQVLKECHSCSGSGYVMLEKCQVCGGTGIIDEVKTLKIRIPQGIDSGLHLKFSGEGDAGKFGAQSGDLYVEIKVNDTPGYKRMGNDLIKEVEMSIYSLILGDELNIDTFDGLRKIKIEPGHQLGDDLILEGLGIPDMRSKKRGNMIIKIKARIPKSLTKDEKELFMKLKSIEQQKMNK